MVRDGSCAAACMCRACDAGACASVGKCRVDVVFSHDASVHRQYVIIVVCAYTLHARILASPPTDTGVASLDRYNFSNRRRSDDVVCVRQGSSGDAEGTAVPRPRVCRITGRSWVIRTRPTWQVRARGYVIQNTNLRKHGGCAPTGSGRATFGPQGVLRYFRDNCCSGGSANGGAVPHKGPAGRRTSASAALSGVARWCAKVSLQWHGSRWRTVRAVVSLLFVAGCNGCVVLSAINERLVFMCNCGL